MDEIERLKNKFYAIKRLGWIKTDRDDYSGIGITFERLLGINSNELELPDFENIEIKTKTDSSNSYTTLFNCTPTGPHYHEVERLKDLYGYNDSQLSKYKVLNIAIYNNKKVKSLNSFYFKLKVDLESEKIFLTIFDKSKNVLEDCVYWDFDILKEKLYRKLQYLALIKAKKTYVNGKKHFKYYEMNIYKLRDFKTFISLIESGKIRICFKIGVFKSGNKKGKIHDRGTAFTIKEENLKYLYNLISTFN